MGHTHAPVMGPLRGGVCYDNLGHWGQDDLPEDLPQHVSAPCSHLVIVTGPDGVRAELRRWDAGRGPRPCVPGREAHAATGQAPQGTAPALC